MSTCRFCNGTDIHYSESRGETYCTTCGAVLEENHIVEAVSFAETSTGSVRATGQFIPSSGFGSAFASRYGRRDSRGQSVERGYAHIQRIAGRLHLPLTIVEAAQRIYLMGVQRNFTTGRIASHVAAACLYIGCRREKAPYLLIDFSDVLLTPVVSLGRIFIKLLHVLRITVPTVDPSLFMDRFASQLPLGAKASTVTQTAVRLVQAMTRDWITTGRRPLSLCGAALLIAARFHECPINPEDVVPVVRMSLGTIRKRLCEFRRTSAAQLAAGDFESIDLLVLPVLQGPPCFSRRPRQLNALTPEDIPSLESGEKRLALPKPDMSGGESDKALSVTESEALPENLQGEVKPLPPIHREEIQLELTEDEICLANPSSSSITSLANRLISAIEHQVPACAATGKKSDGGPGRPAASRTRMGSQSVEESQHASSASPSRLSAETSDREVNPTDASTVPASDRPDDENDEGNLEESTKPTTDSYDPLRALLAEVSMRADDIRLPEAPENNDSLIHDTSISATGSVSRDSSAVVGLPDDDMIEESLSDISDSEIESYLLSKEESVAKALIWDELMKGVMPEIHRRLKVQREREAEGKALPSSKRRSTSAKVIFGEEPAASPSEAVLLALEGKQPSIAKRVNKDALDSLFSFSSTLKAPTNMSAEEECETAGSSEAPLGLGNGSIMPQDESPNSSDSLLSSLLLS